MKAHKLNTRLLQQIPFEIVQEYSVIPLEIRDQVLIVAVANPRTSLPKEELKVLTGTKDVQCVLCLPEQVEDIIREQYN